MYTHVSLFGCLFFSFGFVCVVQHSFNTRSTHPFNTPVISISRHIASGSQLNSTHSRLSVFLSRTHIVDHLSTLYPIFRNQVVLTVLLYSRSHITHRLSTNYTCLSHSHTPLSVCHFSLSLSLHLSLSLSMISVKTQLC